MQKSCANPWCQQSFEITDEDLAFYEKVSPVFNGKKELIPPPTRCPECRQQRRLAWRNERSLYTRKCDATGTRIVSIYQPASLYTVYSQDVWWSDACDTTRSAVTYDPQQSLMKQWKVVQRSTPRRHLISFQNENSDYTNVCSGNNNCYYLFSSDDCERCFYVNHVQKCVSCIDCSVGEGNTSCANILTCIGCHTCQWMIECNHCSDCAFCRDCNGCRHCTLCTGLRSKEYCFKNKQLTPEEYAKHVKSLQGETFSGQCSAIQYRTTLDSDVVRRFAYIIGSEQCTGDYISNCKGCRMIFNSLMCQDCSYSTDIVHSQDCMDCIEMGYSSLCYDVIEAFPKAYHDLFSCFTANTESLMYCDHCYNSKHLFACVGMKNAAYCILNKQYTKDEYERLVPKIIEKMRADGEWGEFFPPSMSPFGYNETVAQEYFPLTKELALERGFRWSDYEPPMPKAERIIKAEQLPDSIDDVPDDILAWAIECAVTKKPFKIIKQELDFYRTMRLPVPRLHPDERHRRRMALRNPRKLWDRECAKCQKPISTSYSPERPEKVVCEECYLKEVY